MTLAINGLGRMGRTILRLALQRGHTVKALNDIAKWDILSYLIEFDTTHGKFNGDINFDNNTLYINGEKIFLSNHANPKDIDFGEVDIVVESSGKFLTSESVEYYLKKGAKRVIISAPPHDDTKTFVLGVNHLSYQGESIISNASCTTNCIAPICYILDKHYGITHAMMTTIHSYTNDQNLLDVRHKDLRRARAAALNMIPTSTGAAKAIGLVLPHLSGKLNGIAVRVPTPDVSLVDVSFTLKKSASKDSINEAFYKAENSFMKGLLLVDTEQRVSSDFIGSPYSAIVVADKTITIGERNVKILAWYDNEMGYSHRLVDMAAYICRY